MASSYKKSVLLLVALITLGSCSSPNIEIVDHGLHGAEHAVPLGVQSEAAVTAVTVSAAEPIPVPVTAAAAEEIPLTAAPDEDREAEETAPPADLAPIVSTNSYMLNLSAKTKTYTYEKQQTNGSMSILGANLVYVGETFDFDYTFPDANKDSRVRWSVSGDGKITQKGVFTAASKGVCVVTAHDDTSGTFAAMRVHCIESADDVDFIPLVNGIPIANKTYPLPKDYDPGLSANAKSAFLKMQTDAKAQGLSIYPISAYRNYAYQKQVYNGWVKMYGSDADLISARPGHSEHQLGLAIDVNSAEYAFANTREGKWLAAHCAEYGFILRYPSNEARSYTGYSYEPWHIRYVGVDLAKKITASGKTLEELLGIDSRYR